MMEKEEFIQTTKEGRLYIKTTDFFKQKKVQETIIKLQDSFLYKQIEAQKKKERKSA